MSMILNSLSSISHAGQRQQFIIEHKGFRIGKMLSKDSLGSFGVVVEATKIGEESKQLVAKFFGYTGCQPQMNWILREIDNLLRLQGVEGVAAIEASFLDSREGLLSHHGISKKQPGIYPVIVMERCEGGDLYTRIFTLRSKSKTFSEADASRIFRSFIVALHQVHDRSMINCDLKAENLVFVSEDSFDIKIIDFGLATFLWDREEHYELKTIGTLSFVAPESVCENRFTGQVTYSRATDMWQAGCILYFMLTMDLPFGAADERYGLSPAMKTKICRGEYDKSKLGHLSANATDLIDKMFAPNPRQRISATEILAHPWITGVNTLPHVDLGMDHAVKAQALYLLRTKCKPAQDILDIFCDSPRTKRARCEEVNEQVTLVDFVHIRNCMIKAFQALEKPVEWNGLPFEPRLLFEFEGVDFDEFLTFVTEGEFDILRNLLNTSALDRLDVDKNRKINYFEIMFGLGPLLNVHLGSNHDNSIQSLSRSNSAVNTADSSSSSSSSGSSANSANNKILVPFLSLEACFELFNVYNADFVTSDAISQALAHIIGNCSNVNQFRPSKSELTREEFDEYFRAIIQSSSRSHSLRNSL